MALEGDHISAPGWVGGPPGSILRANHSLCKVNEDFFGIFPPQTLTTVNNRIEVVHF